MIPSWSHSRVIEFEKCKARIYYMQVEKLPEPERPLPPGKTEHANDRGTRIHEGCELFVRGTGALPVEAKKTFSHEFDALRTLYQAGKVSLEGEWGMNRGWEPTGWRGAWEEVQLSDLVANTLTGTLAKNIKTLKVLPEYGKLDDVVKVGKQVFIWVPAWLRLKLDALVHVSATEAIAIDFKSGRKFGNELKHAEQLQLYQLVTFLRYPELEVVHTELWYLDVDELTQATFTRFQGLRFMKSWEKRGNALTTCQDFPPNPNQHSCRYCGYGPWNDGPCKVGKR